MLIQCRAAQPAADGDFRENHVYESVDIIKERNFYGPKSNQKTAHNASGASYYYDATDIKSWPEGSAKLHGVQSVYNVLEEPYAESAEERSYYGPLSLAIDEPIYSTVEESQLYDIQVKDNSEGTYEPIYTTIEEESREGNINNTQ